MAAINASLIDTIAACGDVNRNVMCERQPGRVARPCRGLRVVEAPVGAPAAAHPRLPRDLAGRREGRRHGGGRADLRADLPAAQVQDRPSPCRRCNDVDVFAHDLGFIAIVEDGEARGLQPDRGRRHGRHARRSDDLSAHRRRRSASARPTSCSRWPRPSSRCSATSATARTASTRGSSTPIDDRGLDWFVAEIDAPPAASRSRRRGRSSSPRPATASAGSRASTAAGT